MTNAVCKSHNKSWVIIETCRLHAIQRNKTILNVMVNFLHPTNSVSMRVQILKKANGYKPWIFDVTFDACKFIKDKSNKAVKVIFDLFKDFSSLNHTCPYVNLQKHRYIDSDGIDVSPPLLLITKTKRIWQKHWGDCCKAA
ncbi:uncharacterized protein LOC117574458 isoform X2 [Drosophila albomicans]|uniref:Uncharacterized protein LOC117574458 isoform X2 n=1 Tax=Drosophila albomicans TaxID=7291 RepID=A0A9C6TBF9_DROAB|nr:uncharacterized protein LOC117574458 isoform X2 [Drosophila albomicans]